MRLNVLVLVLSVALVGVGSTSGSTGRETAAAEVAIGMPFEGRWAYNIKRKPPYTDRNSSHPSVHALYTNGSDWSTDLYAKEGTQVRLLLSSAAGTVRIERRSSGDSCGSGVGGSRISYNVYLGKTYVGWISFSHVDNARTSPPFENGMIVGTVTAEQTKPGCYEARHVHVELANDGTGGHACWIDHGNVGTPLAQGAVLGRLGSENAARRQACAATPTPVSSAPMKECGPLPIRLLAASDRVADAVSLKQPSRGALRALLLGMFARR